MLRTNLSTRPFYNVRAVRAIIAGLSAVVALATAYNVIELARLTTQQRSLSADAVAAETEAGRLTREAAQVRGRIDPTEIDSVAAAAREANAIIDRRAFSWTTLFAQFESALPTDVRITAVQPRRETDGTFAVSVAVQSRRIEAVDGFIEALEALGTFKNVLPTEEQTTEDGLDRGGARRPIFPRGTSRGGHSLPGRSPRPRVRAPRATESSPMTEILSPLVVRVASENKRVLVMLLVGVGVNVLLYAFGVYPLSQRVANVSDRNASAARALVAARQENGTATGTLAGKDRAVTELATFYTSVLPRDLASARRLTHLRIAQLARQHGLRYSRAQSEPVPERNSTLTRLKIDISLAGVVHGDPQLRARAGNGARVRRDRQRAAVRRRGLGRRPRSSHWLCPLSSAARSSHDASPAPSG